MPSIKKLVENHKGIFSFWLIVVFITAFTARNFIHTLPATHKEGAVHTSAGKQIFSSAHEAGKSQSLLEQLQDTDSDDVEVIFYNYRSLRPFAFIPASQDFAQFEIVYSKGSIPLYDLYCNWKFHLS